MSRIILVCGILLSLLALSGCGASSTNPVAEPAADSSRLVESASKDQTGHAPAPSDNAISASSVGVPTSEAAAAQEATEKPPVDPDIEQSRLLVRQLLASGESPDSSVAERLRTLKEKAVPALLAALVTDDDRCHPVVLSLLHEQTGYAGPIPLAAFVFACLPEDQRSGEVFRDMVVPSYRLTEVIASASHAERDVRRGALRYLRQLGYVGEDRLIVADVAWQALQFEPEVLVRREAASLRREQTALAISMINRNLSSFDLPCLPKTADWLASLGAEAVRRGMQEPKVKLRFNNAQLATHGMQMEFQKRECERARREYFEKVRADVIQHARDAQLARNLHLSPNLRRVIPRGVNLAALNGYVESALQAGNPLQDQLDREQGELERKSKEASVAEATLSISTLEAARDAWLIRAACQEAEVSVDDMSASMPVDSPVHQLAARLAKQHLKDSRFAAATFWANEAIACYLEWANETHIGWLEAALVSAQASQEMGDYDASLNVLDLMDRELVTVENYTNVTGANGDARPWKAAFCVCRASILQHLGRPDEAAFYQREQQRFLEPAPAKNVAQEGLKLWEKGEQAFDRGDYSEAADVLWRARHALDPPYHDILTDVRRLHQRLGYSLLEVGRASDALCIARGGLILATRESGEQGSTTHWMYLLLGAAQQETGLLAEAESNIQLARSLHEERTRSAGDTLDLKHLAACDHYLGLLRLKQGKRDEAQELLHAALNGRKTVLGDNHPLTMQTQRVIDALSSAQ